MKKKVILIGILLLSITLIISISEFMGIKTGNRISIWDTYLGYLILLGMFIIAISLISYGFRLKLTLSKLGKYIVDFHLSLDKKQ